MISNLYQIIISPISHYKSKAIQLSASIFLKNYLKKLKNS